MSESPLRVSRLVPSALQRVATCVGRHPLRSAVVAALSLALFASAPAFATATTGTGHITGMVTDGTAPLSGVRADAYQHGAPGSWNWKGGMSTGANGTYDIGGLATGKYLVEFYTWVDPLYRVQFYKGKHDFSEGNYVSVTSGTTVKGIDCTFLPGGGTIAGTVTNGVAPLGDVTVSIIQSTGAGNWETIATTVTAGDGKYAVSDLLENVYRVKFNDASGVYATQYYHLPASGSISLLDVTPNATATANISLHGQGHIQGTVTESGHPASGIFVYALQSDGAGNWVLGGVDYTSSDGTYDVSGLSPGVYHVSFSDQTRGYPEKFYRKASTIQDGTDVMVTAGGTTTGVDGNLDEGGHITGRVTNGRVPLDSVTVTAFKDDGAGGWIPVNDVYTASDGTYDFPDLATGKYRIQFSDPARIYLTQCYAGIDSTDTASLSFPTIEAATDIRVREGAVTTGIDGTLTPKDYPSSDRMGSSISVGLGVSAARALSPRSFALSGSLNPGRRGDKVSVEVMKPGRSRWSYSSARLAYSTTHAGYGKWQYVYKPLLRGRYRFRVRFAGAASRKPSLSRSISVMVR